MVINMDPAYTRRVRYGGNNYTSNNEFGGTRQPLKKQSLPFLHMNGNSSPSSSASSTLSSSSNDVKSNLNELKASMSEMSNLNKSSFSSSSATVQCSSSSSEQRNFSRSISSSSGNCIRPPPFLKARSEAATSPPTIVEIPSSSAMTNVDDYTEEGHPIVTSPVSEIGEIDLNFSDSEKSGLTSPNLVSSIHPLSSVSLPSSREGSTTVSSKVSKSYEERKTSTKSASSLSTTEKAVANSSNLTRVQAGDVSFQEQSAAALKSSRMFDSDSGIVAEKASGMRHRQRILATGERIQAESSTAAVSGTKVSGSGFTSQNVEKASSSQRSTVRASGEMTRESHQSSSKKMSFSSLSRSSSLLNNSQINQMMSVKLSMEELDRYFLELDDLDTITPQTNLSNVQNALVKYCGVMSNTVEAMKNDGNKDSLTSWIKKVNDMMSRAWKVPSFGYEIGNTLCDIMRNNGGLDILIENCIADHQALQFNSAKLLQQCLVTENRGYVVEKGLDKVVALAKKYSGDFRDIPHSRVGTGILEHLFKHSETTCGNVIAMGGLDTVVAECKSTDVETLRHCASALANVAMYGGSENQEAMIQRKIPFWLFPLAFHNDDTIKYYACLAIAVLVANKEIEAAVQKSGTLELIEPFVQSHTPAEFAEISAAHSHGQSPHWLKRLIPVLTSQREEARNLAAFHFSMEAEIKKQQGNSELFYEIGAIESLKKVASSPSGLAAKYAAQTLRTIGEEIPHKLSQQVPTWCIDDVKEWVKQIGFSAFSDSFFESRVDGDLLLQLNEDMLNEDIGMKNGILRRRFMRELSNLKKLADYSSCDSTSLNGFLSNLGTEYCVYTYEMLNAGIDRDVLLTINDEQLLIECGIRNRIHRLRIQQGVKIERGDFSISGDDAKLDKTLDVFISYRRSNGSQLASLLKVHLEIRNYSVFLDVDRLEAGKFDNNLLQSIRSAKNFILVCTPGAMERCFNDTEQRDWIHKEIACAIQSKCNIIPVFDNFLMPDSLKLPESMRAITSYNGVKWIHDYQEACVDKVDRFIRGDSNFNITERFLNSQCSSSTGASFGRHNYARTLSNDNSVCSDENTNSSGKD
ncbi:NAD(+) hydrolase sarm1 [Lepeophtheirus salmonis]|uniref:NAD(+) hydrolase sarm1 n=1 Tax=Lepeophtheirus salmonis TaxID=72036 RepID=UPI001AE5A6F0|nr:NAD(+) hydrolase sarm1-like [Lepeophtheirus salmonis]